MAARATGFDGDEVARRLELREACGIGGGKELDGSNLPHGWGSRAKELTIVRCRFPFRALNQSHGAPCQVQWPLACASQPKPVSVAATNPLALAVGQTPLALLVAPNLLPPVASPPSPRR